MRHSDQVGTPANGEDISVSLLKNAYRVNVTSQPSSHPRPFAVEGSSQEPNLKSWPCAIFPPSDTYDRPEKGRENGWLRFALRLKQALRRRSERGLGVTFVSILGLVPESVEHRYVPSRYHCDAGHITPPLQDLGTQRESMACRAWSHRGLTLLR